MIKWTKNIAMFALASIIILLVTFPAFAHSGRTDSNGGHNKTSDGTYHYHRGDDRTVEYSTPQNIITTAPTPAPISAPITTPETTATSADLSWKSHYKQADYKTYSKPASENGLGDTLVWVEGEIKGILKLEDIHMLTLVDKDSNSWLLSASATSDVLPGVGNKIKAYGGYLGVATALGNLPTIHLIRYVDNGTEKLTNIAIDGMEIYLDLESDLAKNQKTTIDKYYKEFPIIPNFGYYANVEPINVSENNGIYTYKYDSEEIVNKNDDVESIGFNWGQACAKSGFSKHENSEDDITVTDGKLLVTFSYTDDSMFVTICDFKKEAAPTAIPSTITAISTASTVYVDGKKISFDAYNIDGSNYFKLRDLAHSLNGSAKQFEVSFDNASNAISLFGGRAYTAVGGEMQSGTKGTKTATPTTSKIMLNGQQVQPAVYNIDNNNFFKLRDIGQAFNICVWYEQAANAIHIETDKPYDANYTGPVSTPVTPVVPAPTPAPTPEPTPQSTESVHIKLAKDAYAALPSTVKFPSTLVVHSIQGGYAIPLVSEQPVVLIEYSAENNLGTMVRGYLYAYYNLKGGLDTRNLNSMPSASTVYRLFPIDMAEII